MLTRDYRVITEKRWRETAEEFKPWVRVCDWLKEAMEGWSSQVDLAIGSATLRQNLVRELFVSQYFTFDSIRLLQSSGRFADAHGLLRSLFEGSVHAWHLGKCGDEEVERYSCSGAVQTLNLAQSLNKLAAEGGYRQFPKAVLSELKQKGAAASKWLQANDLKPKYYAHEIANLVDEMDKSYPDEAPLRSMTFRKLGPIASAILHRTAFGMREGYSIRQSPQSGVVNLLPNPELAAETAYVACVAVSDTGEAFARCFGLDYALKVIASSRHMIHRTADMSLLRKGLESP